MFWKPLDNCSKIDTSPNQKIYKNTSKIGPKVKKSISRNLFNKSECTFTTLSQLLDKLQEI